MSKQNENKALTTALKVLTWYTADHQQVAGILDGLDCVFEEVETLHDEDAEKIALYWGLQDMKAVTVSRISFSKYPDFLIRLVVDERVASVTELPEVGARALRLFSNGSSTEISPLSTQTRNSSELVESANNDSSFDLLHIASDEYIEEVDFYTKVLGKSARFVEDDIIINNPLSSMSSILLERLEEPLESDGVTSRFPTAGWVMTSYETKDIGEILARAHATQNKVYRTPRKIKDPVLGSILTMSLLSPSGMVVEVYQEVKG